MSQSTLLGDKALILMPGFYMAILELTTSDQIRFCNLNGIEYKVLLKVKVPMIDSNLFKQTKQNM